MISDDDYAKAIKTIYDYRKERGMDFYMVVNVIPPDAITAEELKRYLEIQKML